MNSVWERKVRVKSAASFIDRCPTTYNAVLIFSDRDNTHIVYYLKSTYLKSTYLVPRVSKTHTDSLPTQQVIRGKSLAFKSLV